MRAGALAAATVLSRVQLLGGEGAEAWSLALSPAQDGCMEKRGRVPELGQ